MPNKPSNQPKTANRQGNSRQTSNRNTSNRKYAERQAAKQQAAMAARRRRNQRYGSASIVLVIVIVAVFVIVKVSGGGSSGSGNVASPPAGTPIAATTLAKLASVPLSTLDNASTGGITTSPQTISDATLKADGKPELLFVGAEFCPICAAERWGMYVALSKFGTFSPQPGRIHSAVRDGDIPTLTFYKTTYTSPYLSFIPEEIETNMPDGNSYVPLQTLTAAQQRIWVAHTGESFPFLDFGGKVDLTSSEFDPTLLEGPTFSEIVSDIGNNSTTIGANIDASAKVLIQTICTSLTENKPADVCKAVGNG